MPANEPLDELITATAARLQLPVEPAWRPAIRTHLGIALGMARMVESFDLPDDAEPAPVFRA